MEERPEQLKTLIARNLMRFRAVLLILPLSSLILLHEAPAAESLSVQGITVPYLDSTLSPAVSGIISAIVHKEGEAVRRGDDIVILENSEEALELEMRKFIYDGSYKLYEKTTSISKEELQKEKIEYKLAEARFDKRKVTAPFDGVIIKIFHEVGENSRSEEPLVRIADISKCRFIAHLDASVSWRLEAGMKVRLLINDAGGTMPCEGVIEYISPTVDPSSGLREIKVLFENPQNKIHPGVPGVLTLNNADGS